MALADDADSPAMRELRRQARVSRPLASAEEHRLLERSALGDRSSEDRLIAAHLPMIIRLAEQRGDRGLALPDLVQEGSLGLLEAMRGFAESGATDFASFAEQKVSGQMDAAIEAEESAVREAQQLVDAATDYDRTEILLRHELKRDATLAEIAEKLEWTMERTRYVAEVVADARRRHDEEILSLIDPEAVDLDDEDGESSETDA